MIIFVMLPSYFNHHFMDIAVVMMKIVITIAIIIIIYWKITIRH